jgi:hypothetical protein
VEPNRETKAKTTRTHPTRRPDRSQGTPLGNAKISFPKAQANSLGFGFFCLSKTPN